MNFSQKKQLENCVREAGQERRKERDELEENLIDQDIALYYHH